MPYFCHTFVYSVLFIPLYVIHGLCCFMQNKPMNRRKNTEIEECRNQSYGVAGFCKLIPKMFPLLTLRPWTPAGDAVAKYSILAGMSTANAVILPSMETSPEKVCSPTASGISFRMWLFVANRRLGSSHVSVNIPAVLL